MIIDFAQHIKLYQRISPNNFTVCNGFGVAAGLKSRFVGLDGEQCNVEEFALQHYAAEEHGGWKGATFSHMRTLILHTSGWRGLVCVCVCWGRRGGPAACRLTPRFCERPD